jgi:RNase H-like domain found in reverse transcriptase
MLQKFNFSEEAIEVDQDTNLVGIFFYMLNHSKNDFLTINKECLAVVKSLKDFTHIAKNLKEFVQVLSVHLNLAHMSLCGISKLQHRQWYHKLNKFIFGSISYKSGETALPLTFLVCLKIKESPIV